VVVIVAPLSAAADLVARVPRAHDCTVVVLAPPLDPAGSIRGNAILDHDVAMLADRARRRDGDSVHGIARRVTEPASTVLGDVTATPSMASNAARPSHAATLLDGDEGGGRAPALHLVGRESRYPRAWCEDRAKRPAGPTGVARRATPLVRACDVADKVASLASAAARRCRHRCPCRVSASQRGRDRRAALCRSRRRCRCRVSARSAVVMLALAH
jgi:hypothetical protein